MSTFPMYRYLILVAAVVMQMCLGATYSWAVFVEPLKQWFGRGQAAIQWPFTIFYIVFPLTVACSGYVLEKLGTRVAALPTGQNRQQRNCCRFFSTLLMPPLQFSPSPPSEIHVPFDLLQPNGLSFFSLHVTKWPFFRATAIVAWVPELK